MVLAADGLNARVVTLLDKVARHGWTELPTGTPGLPAGWSAFRDVQVLARPEGPIHLDLQSLLPRASVSLVLTGGLVLPGLLRKWSSLAPPEVHAASPGADSLLVEVNRRTRVGDPVNLRGYAPAVSASARPVLHLRYPFLVRSPGRRTCV